MANLRAGGLIKRSCFSGRDKGYVSTSEGPEWLWVSSVLLFGGYHLPLCSLEVNNEWKYISTSSICRHYMNRNVTKANLYEVYLISN